jgi:putative DNA primase/helicase
MDARAITEALGGKWQGLYGPCRCPVHADSNPSLKVRNSDRRGIDVHCFTGCDWKDIKDELRRQGLLTDNFLADIQSRAKVIAETVEDGNKNIDLAISLWRGSVLLPGTLGETYFVKQRNLPIRNLDLEHAVRYHPVHRMVVALMTDAISNKPCGVHRTFLDVDGKKRERKMLGRQGVVRVTPNEDVTDGLGIAEGVEDAIAVALDWGPAWAATSAGAMERFPVLSGIDCINIFPDFDAAGMTAASACAKRWIAAGKEARISNL